MLKIKATKFIDNVYYVTLWDKKHQKEFLGKCKLHEEDYDRATRFFGYEIAELRAYVNYYKYNLQRVKLIQKGITDFYNKFKNNKCFNSKGYIEKKLKKEIYLYQKEINSLNNFINITKGNIVGKLKLMDKMK